MQDDALSAMTLSNSSSRLLFELLHHRGQALSRDVLLETVWDNYGLVSSNSNLNHYMSRLRKKLDFFNVPERGIITVPKKGFKFNENVPVILLSQSEDGRSNVTEQTLEVQSTEVLTDPPAVRVTVDVTSLAQATMTKHHKAVEPTTRSSGLFPAVVITLLSFILLMIVVSVFLGVATKVVKHPVSKILTASDILCPKGKKTYQGKEITLIIGINITRC